MEIIFNNLQEWKTYKKKTIKEIAKLFEISQIYTSLLLTNKRRPSPELAQKISSITGISILNLLYPKDEERN